MISSTQNGGTDEFATHTHDIISLTSESSAINLSDNHKRKARRKAKASPIVQKKREASKSSFIRLKTISIHLLNDNSSKIS